MPARGNTGSATQAFFGISASSSCRTRRYIPEALYNHQALLHPPRCKNHDPPGSVVVIDEPRAPRTALYMQLPNKLAASLWHDTQVLTAAFSTMEHFSHGSGWVMAAPIHSPRVASRANMPEASNLFSQQYSTSFVRLPKCAYRKCSSYAPVTTQPTSARTTEGGVNGNLTKRKCKAAKWPGVFSSHLLFPNQGTEAPCGAPGNWQASPQAT